MVSNLDEMAKIQKKKTKYDPIIELNNEIRAAIDIVIPKEKEDAEQKQTIYEPPKIVITTITFPTQMIKKNFDDMINGYENSKRMQQQTAYSYAKPYACIGPTIIASGDKVIAAISIIEKDVDDMTGKTMHSVFIQLCFHSCSCIHSEFQIMIYILTQMLMMIHG